MLNEFFYGWLIVALLFLIMEIGSPGLFFFLSFSFGAICSSFTSFFVYSFTVQLITFLVATLCAFILLRYWVRKRMMPRHVHPTNIHALRGKRGRVIKDIMPESSGQVKVRGEIWSAQTHDNQIIEKDSIVEVIDIKGVHLIVKEMKG